MSTVERKVRKPGLYDSQIIKAKCGSTASTLKRRKGLKAISKAHSVRLDLPIGMGAHSFTEHGDFISCFRRGI